MTADPDPWIEEKAKKEGVIYFLKKPFSQKNFHTVLDDLKFKNG
jgi:FixJ family two-component response regulator